MKNKLLEFCENYNCLEDREEEKFIRIVNKLINVNYLTAEKEEDKQDYYFIINHFNCFKNYLELGGMELKKYDIQKTIVLTNEYSKKEQLKRINSIVLLIIRLLYHQKLHDISLENQILITIKDIQEKYDQVMINSDERIKKTELEESLKLFRRHNLIDYKGNDFQNDDFLIIIYPTIQYAIDINSIEAITEKLETYDRKQVNDEETNED